MVARDVRELLYPVICLVCGDRLRDETHLCSFCLDHAFEPANSEGNDACEGLIMPEWIRMQDSLWEFDKGGFLQDVLHQVKYSGLAALGVTLGRQLGYKLRRNRWLTADMKTVLLPVPLHPARKRKRGYNQSAKIAEGVADVTGSVIADEKAVIRVKKTRTQTGLSARVRRANIDSAFRLQHKELFRDEPVIIIDDVITTGATTLELAGLVRKHTDVIGIATIARA